MFCPNCGRDCADARFCSECGQELRGTYNPQSSADRQRESQESRQTYCPQCKSTSVTIVQTGGQRYPRYHRSALALLLDFLDIRMERELVQKNGEECVCMQCGYKWRAKQVARQKKYREILSKHLGTYSMITIDAPGGACLQLGENELTLWFSQNHVCVIPYDEIADVAYQGNLGPLYGWLSVRDAAHRSKRFPRTFSEAKKDKSTIFCSFGYEGVYQEIYKTLKIIAEENKKAGLL